MKHFTYGKIESPQFREVSFTKARHMSASFVTPQTQTATCHALNEAHIWPLAMEIGKGTKASQRGAF